MMWLGKDSSKSKGYNAVKNFYPNRYASSSFCTLPNTEGKSAIMTLRGLCDRTLIDRFYQIRNDDAGYVTYIGFQGTIIFLEIKELRWKLMVRNNKKISGETKGYVNSFNLSIAYHLIVILSFLNRIVSSRNS